MSNDQCEGCDKPGTTDWCGHWLCKDCLLVEQQEADPALRDYQEWERRFEAAKNWPACQRGDTMQDQRHWAEQVMRAVEKLSREG